MPTHRHARVLIIGSGAAGYPAAVYAARAGPAPILVPGSPAVRQRPPPPSVEHYPGFADPVTGPLPPARRLTPASEINAIPNAKADCPSRRPSQILVRRS